MNEFRFYYMCPNCYALYKHTVQEAMYCYIVVKIPGQAELPGLRDQRFVTLGRFLKLSGL